MLKFDKDKSLQITQSLTYRQLTPDGVMFVRLNEDKGGNLCAISMEIGKGGTSLRAYNMTVSRLLTMLLEKGASIYEILEELSNQTSDRESFIGNGRKVRSSIEALYVILTDYNREKIIKEQDGDREKVGYFRNRRLRKA